MNKIILIITVIFCINSYSQEIKTEDWITDLNFLKTELIKKHKNLFFKLSKQDFELELNSIIKNLEKDNDKTTFFKINQLLAKIGDSHTAASTSHILKGVKTIPMQVEWFDDSLYISGTSKDNYEILGQRLVSINGYKLERILDSLSTLFVNENIGMANKKTAKLIRTKTVLKYFNFSKENDDVYHLGLINLNGKLSNYKLKEVEISNEQRKNNISLKVNNEKPFYRNGSGKSFKEKYYPEDKIYIIQYNKCFSKETVEKYGKKEFAYKHPSFDEFETKVLKTIKSQKIDKLIFDLRFNQGGFSYLAENLINKICENKKINKEAHLFVAVGNLTYSSAIINAVNFKGNSKAIIIGEKTSGKPNHYGNGLHLTSWFC